MIFKKRLVILSASSYWFGTKSSEPSGGSWRGGQGISGPPGTGEGAAPTKSSPNEGGSTGTCSTAPWSGERGLGVAGPCMTVAVSLCNLDKVNLFITHCTCFNER